VWYVQLFCYCKNWHHTNKWAQSVNPLGGPHIHYHSNFFQTRVMTNSKLCHDLWAQWQKLQIKSIKGTTLTRALVLGFFFYYMEKQENYNTKMVSATTRIKNAMSCISSFLLRLDFGFGYCDIEERWLHCTRLYLNRLVNIRQSKYLV
jgi:hypothetical protein